MSNKKIHINTQIKNAYNKIVNNVNSKFGSPMGRSDKGVFPKGKKVYTRKVPLVYDGVYDKGGAYWGSPNNLQVVFTLNLEYIHFYRKPIC